MMGAGLTKGSEGITIDGENIKAGKFPVLFFANKAEQNKKRDNRSGYDNTRLLKRVTALQNKTKCNDNSRSTQGNIKNV